MTGDFSKSLLALQQQEILWPGLLSQLFFGGFSPPLTPSLVGGAVECLHSKTNVPNSSRPPRKRMAAAPSAPRPSSISLSRGSSGRRGLTTGEDKELRDRQQGHVREETSEKWGKNRAVGHEEKEEDLEWEEKPLELSVVVGQKPEGTLWSYSDRASLGGVHPSLSERRGHVCIYSQIGRTTWSKYFILIYVQAALGLKSKERSRNAQKETAVPRMAT